MRSQILAAWAFTACQPDDPVVRLSEDEVPPPAACSPADVAIARRRRFADLQSAIDSLGQGGTVWICPGRHVMSSIELDGRFGAVRVSGVTGNPHDVVIDGDRGGDLFIYQADGVYEFSSFTTTNTGLDGSPVSVFQSTHAGSGQLAIRRVISEDHVGTSPAVDVDTVSFVLEESEFVGFGARSTGVVGCSMDPYSPSSVTIRRTRFDDIDSSSGAQLFVNNGSRFGYSDRVVVEDVEFTRGSISVFNVSSLGPDSTVLLDHVLIADAHDTPITPTCTSNINADGVGFRLGMRDVTFRDHESYLSSALCLSGVVPPSGADAWFERVRFHRNVSRRLDRGALEVSDGWRVHLRDSDFGVAPDDNIPYDIYRCPARLGAHVSGELDPARGDTCP